MTKKRFHNVDIFKGICLILVVIHHAPLAYMGHFALKGSFLWYINNIIISFFMPAFFVATGYCTSFKQNFRVYLWKNIKSILIPCYGLYYLNRYLENLNVWLFEDSSWMTLSHWLAPGLKTFIEEGGFYWFLSALFIAKILMYLLCIFQSKLTKITLSLLLMVIGTYLHQFNILPNFFFYQHALILVSFLIFGQILKDFEITLYRVTIITIVPFFAIVFCIPIFGYEIPTITRTIQVSLFSMPIFIFLSLSGSLIFWSISKLISESSWLEFIGRGSLVEYCFNYSTLCLVANVFNHYLGGHILIGDNCACLIISVVTLVILQTFYWFLKQKYLRIILGKY